MDTFGFTRKKFLSLTHRTKHTHIIAWLSDFYQKAAANRISQKSLALFLEQYNRILDWEGLPLFSIQENNTAPLLLEAVSDRINFHRKLTSESFRDHDLLEKIQKGDVSGPEEIPPINCSIALDGMRSLFNTGSIFRICDAAGFKTIILGSTPGREDRRVRKTAMGSDQWVEQETTEDLAGYLFQKKENGYKIIGVETVKNSTPYDRFDWIENSIVVFGNEEYGISSHVLPACDDFVHIPMYGRKNSVNVANAAAVICFHMARFLRSGQ